MTFSDAREIVNRAAYENDFRPIEAHFTGLIKPDGTGYVGSALGDVRHVNWYLRNFNLRMVIRRPAQGRIHAAIERAR
jgi:hypothetical protein